jgi:hypothetical protein
LKGRIFGGEASFESEELGLLRGVRSPVERSSAQMTGKESGELASVQKKLMRELKKPCFSPRQWRRRAGDHPKMSFDGDFSAAAVKSLCERETGSRVS